MKSLRLASVAWILSAIVAGLLGAFLLGMGEHPEERTMGLFLAAGALLAAGSGTVGVMRPSTAFARWSVLLAVVWVIGSIVFVPRLGFESDRLLLGVLPAMLPVVAGLASLSWASRRLPE